MGASVRLLASAAALRRLPLPPPPLLRPISLRNPNPKSLSHLPSPKSTPRPSPIPSSPSSPSSPSPRSTLSLSLSLSLSSFSVEPAHGSSQWDLLPEGSPQARDLGFGRDRGATFTVVLLGWLGADQRHLRKYAEIYSARGIRSVQFVVPVRGVLGFDLGRRIEERIGRFAREIGDWCAEKEGDGRERNLIFHTFSNTGWLTYGLILDNLQQSRADILEKIKGCIVDSGAAAEISPQVWAAGFCAALLKKRSSLTYSSGEAFEGSTQDISLHKLNDKSIKPSLGEIIIFSLLLKFFNIVLSFPDVNRRLSKVISVLSKNQPSCPQLYLYSFADRVIPADSVENFIKEQKTLGRDVYAYNFGSSPHVDHFRSFPQLYTAKIDEFLKICCSATV